MTVFDSSSAFPLIDQDGQQTYQTVKLVKGGYCVDSQSIRGISLRCGQMMFGSPFMLYLDGSQTGYTKIIRLWQLKKSRKRKLLTREHICPKLVLLFEGRIDVWCSESVWNP
jgi:hypothetical protein